MSKSVWEARHNCYTTKLEKKRKETLSKGQEFSRSQGKGRQVAEVNKRGCGKGGMWV